MGLLGLDALAKQPRLPLVYLGACLLALAAFEGYLAHQQSQGDGTRLEGSITVGFTHADDVVGYAPDPSARVTARKLYNDDVIYDVVYTIGRDGMRVAPPHQEPLAGCVVFF